MCTMYIKIAIYCVYLFKICKKGGWGASEFGEGMILV